MKLLILSLIPVLIFWFVEEKFGTFWGIVAAIVWGFLECTYEYIRYRRIQSLTLLSTAFIVVLGSLGLWLDQGAFFKFQPVIMELIFVGILLWGGRGGMPLLLKLAVKTQPKVFNQTPVPGKEAQHLALMEKQKQLMQRLTRHLIAVLIIHSGVLAYLALYGTTGQWAFWKGIGFNVFLLFWMACEIIQIRMKAKNKTKN